MRVLVIHTRPLPDRPFDTPTPWALGPGGQIIGPAGHLEGDVWLLGFTPDPADPFLTDRFIPYSRFWSNPPRVIGMQALIASRNSIMVCPEIVTAVFETTADTPGQVAA